VIVEDGLQTDDLVPVYGAPCADRLAWAGAVCVLPEGHPGSHASSDGSAWGWPRPATWPTRPGD
jgi:hypothetical protein